MTPDFLAQSIIAAAMLWGVMNWRTVARFIEECSDGNVSRLERIDEASAMLAVMCERRVA